MIGKRAYSESQAWSVRLGYALLVGFHWATLYDEDCHLIARKTGVEPVDEQITDYDDRHTCSQRPHIE
jgi:hypothetical protein